jgi:GT2 family glycosyltransferase
MSLPSVHIIILNWNGLEDTRECLRSLQKLTYKNVNIYVIDNASDNNEAEMIEKEFPAVSVLRQSENLGFCGGCNAGIKAALDNRADFIMLLNNDTIVSPSLIEDLLRGFSKLEHPGAFGPIITHYPEKNQVWFSEAKWRTDWKSATVGFRLVRDEAYEQLKTMDPYISDFVCGCCLMVAVPVVRKVGVFDERYFAFYDEAEWCARMSRAGYKSYIIPSAVVHHKVGGSVPNLVLRYLMMRNVLLWMSENLPLHLKIKAFPVLLKHLSWNLLNLAGLLPRSKRYFNKEASRAVILGWKDYLLRRFGKWNARAERILFDRS